MSEKYLDDLAAFIVVAREQSFTKAARKLGVSQSALSQTIKALEEKLQMRLLSRTTRRVSATELGQSVLDSISGRFEAIEEELALLRGQGQRPSGIIRITASALPAETIVWPKLEPLLAEYPELQLEISSDTSLTDIVADRFDAGVRLGEAIEKDMIALPIGPTVRMRVVASKTYLERFGTPEHPSDLTSHECLQIRMPSSGVCLPWEFEKDGEDLRVKVDGRLVCNSRKVQLDAVERGLGLAWVLEDTVRDRIDAGRVVPVLEDWCNFFPGFHLYYPSRRQHSKAFSLVIEALRYRG
ncbi:LysR family transcriptional regulator [Roseibium aggregatum]|uniref:LysR family transcriptional regulator n=1 Tax=Roseibium aggregatum TaxID=187304 RepID=A0A939EB03_9HYPH|nr:LysR family transcriptional regulator [Roseibium aggregatum]MBN9669887.1 LysR family transcriptional regulator [Roseibium aggregatum]